MRVSKETMEKVKRLEKIQEKAERIRAELFKEFQDYMDGVYMEDFHVYDEPFGDDQGDGEYCSQSSYGESSDCGYGTYYYPVEHSKKYIGISYNF